MWLSKPVALGDGKSKVSTITTKGVSVGIEINTGNLAFFDSTISITELRVNATSATKETCIHFTL